MKQSDITRKVLVRFSEKHLSKLLDEILAEKSEFSKHPEHFRFRAKMSKSEILSHLTAKPKFQVKEFKNTHQLYVYMPCTYRGCRDGRVHQDWHSDHAFRVVLDGPNEGTVYTHFTYDSLEQLIDQCIKWDTLCRDMFFDDGTAIPLYI